jgi:hypothetical protein
MDIDRARRDLAHMREQVDKGAIKSIERVAITARKFATQHIQQRLALPSRVIKSKIYLSRPYGSNRLVRDIVASGEPVSIRDYTARKTKRGISYRVSKGASRKIYKAKGNLGFIIDKFGGHVFARTEPDPPGLRKGRIRKVYGPSIPQYFVTRTVLNLIRHTVQERWPIEFTREMKYRRSLQ